MSSSTSLRSARYGAAGRPSAGAKPVFLSAQGGCEVAAGGIPPAKWMEVSCSSAWR